MRIHLQRATADDAAELTRMRQAVNDRLRADFGEGYWTGNATERAALCDIRLVDVYIARWRGQIVASLALQRKKPWAINREFLTPKRKTLYLTRMAVDPRHQRKGLGRQCLDEALRIAKEQGVESICLDAWDCAAGAGPFYEKCGFRELGRWVFRINPIIVYESMI